MTFSIVARDPRNGDLGVAVASRFLAAGSIVPAAIAGVGAIATQALANALYGEQGLALLRAGASASATIDGLVTPDRHAAHRQVGVVDADGRSASYTGSACIGWAGGRTGEGIAAQGNILTGPDVVDTMIETFSGAGGNLRDRLLQALLAADRAGGDKRGRQSAAILVVRAGGGYLGATDRWLDLRVDDHADPIPELMRMAREHHLLADRPAPDELLPLDDRLAAEISALLDRLAVPAPDVATVAADRALLQDVGLLTYPLPPRPSPAAWDDGLDSRFFAWMCAANLEMRAVPSGWIDPEVLSVLRELAVTTSTGR